MKALIYKGKGQVVLEDISLPEPDDHEVLLRLRLCGICGSDIHRIFHGTAVPGVVLGHEWVAEVVRVGAKVTALQIGDRVIPGNAPGWPGWPPPASRNDPPPAASVSGVSGAKARHSPRDNGRNCFPGTNMQGGFAEYALRKWWTVGRVPPALSDEQAAACEPIAVAIHAVREAQVRLGDTVAVIGLGPIGIFAVYGALLQGATRVIAVDPNPSRRAVAASLGPAVLAIDPTAGDALEAIVSAAGGNGPEVAIECAGAPSTLQLALECVTFGGRVALVALRWTETPITPVEWLGRQPTLHVCYAYGTKGWPAAIQLQEQGRIDIQRFIKPSDILPFSKIMEALDLARDPATNSVKIMVDMR